MLKLAKGKGEREKEHKGAKAGTRFILSLSSAVPAQAGLGVWGSAHPPARAQPECVSLHRDRVCQPAHGCVCATLPGQAQSRQPDTLKQIMCLKCECKLGHAWTEPRGHGCAAGACSCRVLGAKPWPVLTVGGCTLHPVSLLLKTSLFLRV